MSNAAAALPPCCVFELECLPAVPSVKMDVGGSNTRCTGLLAHVLDMHMRDMMLDGTLQRLRDKYTASKHDTGFACPPPEGKRKPRAAFTMEVPLPCR